ncbi:MAG TPA: DUF5941 domain-containing protein [Micromonosporaceae bacterium]|nr:DUF5941 domain-containing protein [Micromonosporaceae bacterium]
MTLAVLFPPSQPAAPFTLRNGEPLTDHLGEQLRRAGARDVVVATDPSDAAAVAEAARRGGEPVLLCSGDLVAHTAVLHHLITNPSPASAALLLLGAPPEPGRAMVAEERGQITAVGTAGELPAELSGTFGGALRVAVEDLPALAEVARAEAAGVGGREALPVPDRLLGALTRTGVTIVGQPVRLLVAHRVTDPAGVAAAEDAVAVVDSDAAQLRLSVKEKDDFFTTYAVSTWSPWVTRIAARIGLSPTAVTAVSVLFAFAAAALFAFGGRPAWVAGAVLLYLGFVLDCVDGQLARYTRQFSAWGGWLDTMADRAKEYVVYAGLAAGIVRAGLGDGWTLAIAAITLQTVRHMTDTWYGVLHDEAARRPQRSPAAGGLGARLSSASTRVQADVGSVSYWLKRTVVFPIGERWALIALTVALFNPLVSLVAVLVWGGLAFVYTLALRTLRARSMHVPVLDTVDTSLHRDDGLAGRWVGRLFGFGWLPGPLPLALLAVAASSTMLGFASARWGTAAGWTGVTACVVLLAGAARGAAPHTGASDWLVPAALRAAEYLFVIAVGVWWRVPAPLVFGLLLVLALHHYDLTARLEKRSGRPPLHAATLGWDVRVIVLAAAGPAGVAAAAVGGLAAYLLVIFIAGAIWGWTVAGRDKPTATQSEIAYAGSEGSRR